jgi:ZIP family zinc transporter
MVWFESLSPVCQGLLTTLFTYGVTALGASLVFLFKSINQKILDMMMGFAAGVMIAASFWSLLSPAIDLLAEEGDNAWLIPAIGFLCGGIFIIGTDLLLSKAQFYKSKPAA